jgi:hypothetical protein
MEDVRFPQSQNGSGDRSRQHVEQGKETFPVLLTFVCL